MEGNKYAKDTLPLGVSRLETFCRIGVSTKAAGGQLMPRELSLLSTSNMMASNKRPPEEKKDIAIVTSWFY